MTLPVSQQPQPLPDSARARLGRSQQGRPFFTSDLSVNEFVLTTQAGFEPLGLVLGTCIYRIAHLTFRQMLSNVGQNVELTGFNQAAYDAREIAMARMQYEGEQVGADGIVGVTVDESAWEWGEHAIEFFAMGTAVSRIRPDAQPVSPTLTMPLT